MLAHACTDVLTLITTRDQSGGESLSLCWLFEPLAVDKLEDSGCERFALVWKTNWHKQHERKLPCSSYNHNTPTTLKTSANALQSCSKSFHALNASMQVIPHRCFEGCQCIVLMDERAAASEVALCNWSLMPKINIS